MGAGDILHQSSLVSSSSRDAETGTGSGTTRDMCDKL